MMKGVMRWSIDDILKRMASDHVRVVNLGIRLWTIKHKMCTTYKDTPKVNEHE